MNRSRQEKTGSKETAGDEENQEQKALLKTFMGTVQHFFGSWQTMFKGVVGIDPDLITYPIASLLCTGVLMFIFRLGSRRQVKYQLRENGPSQAKLDAWFEVLTIPHGDTLNYGFKRLQPDDLLKWSAAWWKA